MNKRTLSKKGTEMYLVVNTTLRDDVTADTNPVDLRKLVLNQIQQADKEGYRLDHVTSMELAIQCRADKQEAQGSQVSGEIEMQPVEINIRSKYYSGSCNLVRQRYRDGSISLSLETEQDGPIATLTTNIGAALGIGEFCVKTWSENEGIAESLIEQGVIVPTGRIVSNGSAVAPVCTLSESAYVRLNPNTICSAGPDAHVLLAESWPG